MEQYRSKFLYKARRIIVVIAFHIFEYKIKHLMHFPYIARSNCMASFNYADEKDMRRPGIEPGSQEWESCMIPLHQRRNHLYNRNVKYITV